MKKSIIVIAGVLLSVMMASATDVPKYEVFLGYTYVRANQFSQNNGIGQSIGGYDMNGGSGQFIYNFNKWVGGVFDAGAVYKPNVGIVNVKIRQPSPWPGRAYRIASSTDSLLMLKF